MSHDLSGPTAGRPPPASAVTVLLTDFEDSSRLWATSTEAMAHAAWLHRETVSEVVGEHSGRGPREPRHSQSLVADFARPSDAVVAALEIQRALSSIRWPDRLEGRVRIALHSHDARLRLSGADDRLDIARNRCMGLCAVARGGQTLVSRSTRDLVAERLPGAADLVDLGFHRLPDLGPPARVYQLIAHDLRRDSRPPRSLDLLPNNLPLGLTSFIGRERELYEVSRALEDARLLTLTGSGGVGKTRLALQAAADAASRYPDGVWWVDLSQVSDPALVEQALARTLGMRPVEDRRALDAAVRRLAACTSLVVLDNCEHVRGGAAEVAEALVSHCPETTVLATSRAPLRVRGETIWRVPSLSLPRPQANLSVEGLAESDAARLFLARALRVRPDLAIPESATPALAALCSELDGIPLAIELAAARVSALSIEQIAAGLSNRFHLLTGGASDVQSRHGTLRASVEWSHDLLSDGERTLFRRLGVFTGSFSLDAAERVAALEDSDGASTLETLVALVENSLVAVDDHRTAVRYRLLGTVRDYALERLAEAGELDEVRLRHRDVFIELAETAARALDALGSKPLLETLDADGPNLVAALETATATDPERALRMCAALAIWWRLRGMFAEGEACCARALESYGPEPSALRARVLWARSYLLAFGERYAECGEVAQEALQLAEEVGDASTKARALNVLGTLLHPANPDAGRSLLESSLQLARQAGDQWCRIASMATAAWPYVITEDFEEADRLSYECLPVLERMGYQEFEAWTLYALSLRQAFEGHFEEFFELAERAAAAAREVGEPVIECTVSSFIARIELAQGHAEQALERVEGARERAAATGAGHGSPPLELTRAVIRAAFGETEPARATLEELVATGIDQGWALSWALLELAGLLRVEGETAAAERHARQALDIAQAIRNRFREGWAKEVLGRIAVKRGDWAEARTLLRGSLAAHSAARLRLRLAEPVDGLAELAAAAGEHTEAALLFGVLARARAELGLVRWAPEQAGMDAVEQDLRVRLGEDAFEAAWREGTKLSLDAAVARALGEDAG